MQNRKDTLENLRRIRDNLKHLIQTKSQDIKLEENNIEDTINDKNQSFLLNPEVMKEIELPKLEDKYGEIRGEDISFLSNSEVMKEIELPKLEDKYGEIRGKDISFLSNSEVIKEIELPKLEDKYGEIRGKDISFFPKRTESSLLDSSEEETKGKSR